MSGLPPDTTLEEFVNFMSKCGVAKKDPEDPTKVKCKIYRDEKGNAKGDALFIYYKLESVNLALSILDGSEIRSGFPLKIQQAVYEPKEQQEQNSKPKKRSKKIKLYNQEKELGWEEDENCHVVLKHMFDPKESKGQPNFYEELEEDITTECETIGPVEKIKIFERNPDGVVVVIFEEYEAAKKCVQVMNGRWFASRQIEAEYYDGWTNFNVGDEVDEKEEERRLEEFGNWLEQD